MKIKCNTLQVLHSIFNNTYRDDDYCTAYVKGKTTTKLQFNIHDTATKMFTSEQVGEYCHKLHYSLYHIHSDIFVTIKYNKC